MFYCEWNEWKRTPLSEMGKQPQKVVSELLRPRRGRLLLLVGGGVLSNMAHQFEHGEGASQLHQLLGRNHPGGALPADPFVTTCKVSHGVSIVWPF